MRHFEVPHLECPNFQKGGLKKRGKQLPLEFVLLHYLGDIMSNYLLEMMIMIITITRGLALLII